MLYIEKKSELTNYFKSIPLEQKQQLYRGVRSIIAMLVKVSKMTEIYSVKDKIFDEFNETMKQNLDVIHNLLPYASVTTKKVGFYYQERKIKLFDEGERKFRNIFLANEIRELYFVKGATPEEIRNFFAVIQETLNYTLLDYDFNTRLWDYGITHIGTISDPNMGDPEPWENDFFKCEFEPVAPRELLAAQPAETNVLQETFDYFDALFINFDELDDWKSSRGQDFVVKKYLEKAIKIVSENRNREENRNIVNKICEYAVKNIQEGDFVSGVVYIDSLIQLAKNVETQDDVLFMKIKDVLTRINSEEFLTEIFESGSTIDSSQLKSFGELINLVSATNFEQTFLKLCELENRETRLYCLEGIAQNLKSVELVQKFVEHPDWHIVRNFLYILKFAYNPDFLPQVRQVMNHQVKQIRIEAARVLSLYDADENIEYWERAVFCPDEDVRLMAVENLLKVRETFSAKAIFNEIFKPQNRLKFNLTDYERYIDRILASRRKEFFDLPSTMIFSENKELRIVTLKCLNKIENPSTALMQIKRRIKGREFITLENDEIELILQLMKGEMITPMLESLEYLFTLRRYFLGKKQVLALKKFIFSYIKAKSKKNLAMRNWIEKGLKVGNRETKAILKGRI